jgi:DNA-binding protein YbaB
MYGDPLEELARLRDRADSIVQKVDAAQAGPTTFNGADSTNSVVVTMNAAGHVRDVKVDREWRERLSTGGLPAAVKEAVEAAGISRLQVWSDAFVEQTDSPDPRARPMPLGHESLAYRLDELATARMTSGRGRAALEELLAMAEAVERGIDQVSAQVQAHQSASYAGTSPDGHVTVTITGDGLVTEIRYNQRWLTGTHELTIGTATTKAFGAAYRQAGEHTVADMIAQSPLGEVQALSQDPLGLARRLYLRDE